MSDIVGLIIAVVIAYIAWLQHKLARDKLRLDLFEKRYLVYKGAQNILSKIFAEGRCKYEYLEEFKPFMQDARFLFGDDVNFL